MAEVFSLRWFPLLLRARLAVVTVEHHNAAGCCIRLQLVAMIKRNLRVSEFSFCARATARFGAINAIPVLSGRGAPKPQLFVVYR